MRSVGDRWLLVYVEGSSFCIPGALHVEGNDDLRIFKDDDEACVETEKDGISLIYGMEGVPDRTYVDTDENRDIIRRMLKKYPEYIDVRLENA